PRAFARGIEHLFRVDLLDRALLEFDGVKAGAFRFVDELLGDLEIAVVIDADFSDQKQAHPGGLQSSLRRAAGARRAPAQTRGRASPAAPPTPRLERAGRRRAAPPKNRRGASARDR